MIVTAFYTTGTPYEGEAAALRGTLERFGLEHDIRELPHPGTWAAATLLFPGFIQDMRAAHPGEDVLFLDADARLLDSPSLFARDVAGRYDAALYWLDHSPRGQEREEHRELCTGTSWWAPTPMADAILEAWAVDCRRPESARLVGTDQRVLQNLLPQFPEARIFRLPPEYCWMDTISAARYGTDRRPVILQTQASRRFRNQVSRQRCA